MKFFKRKKIPCLIAAIVILFLTGGCFLYFVRRAGNDDTIVFDEKIDFRKGASSTAVNDIHLFNGEEITPRLDALLSEADSYLVKNEYRKAIKVLNKALKENPEIPYERKKEIYEALATSYRESKDYDAAADYYKILLDKNPESNEYNFRYGYELFRMGEYDESEIYSKKALDINPDDYRAIYTLADIAWSKGEYEKAMGYYKKGLSYKESRHVGASGIVECMVGMNNLKKAAEYSRCFSDTADSYRHLAMIYFDAGYYRESTVEYKKALALEPDSISDISECYLAMDKLNKGEEFLEEYMKKYPAYAGLANYSVGHYYQIAGNFTRAEKFFLKSAGMNKKDILPLMGLIRLYISSGQVEKAEEKLKEARKIEPEDSRVIAAAAWICAVKGKKKEAEKLIDEAVDEAEGDYYTMMESAWACRCLGDNARAHELFSDGLEKVAYLDEEHIIATEELGRILVDMGDTKRAGQKIKTAYDLAKCPHSAIAMGDYYFALKNYQDAEKYYNESLTYPPPYIGAYFKLAKTYMRMNDKSKAIAALNEILKIDPYYKQMAAKDGDLMKLMKKLRLN